MNAGSIDSNKNDFDDFDGDHSEGGIIFDIADFDFNDGYKQRLRHGGDHDGGIIISDDDFQHSKNVQNDTSQVDRVPDEVEISHGEERLVIVPGVIEIEDVVDVPDVDIDFDSIIFEHALPTEGTLNAEDPADIEDFDETTVEDEQAFSTTTEYTVSGEDTLGVVDPVLTTKAVEIGETLMVDETSEEEMQEVESNTATIRVANDEHSHWPKINSTLVLDDTVNVTVHDGLTQGEADDDTTVGENTMSTVTTAAYSVVDVTDIVELITETPADNEMDDSITHVLYRLVKNDVENTIIPTNGHNGQKLSVNFTTNDFTRLISEVHRDELLKVEFKEYLKRLLLKKRAQSDNDMENEPRRGNSRDATTQDPTDAEAKLATEPKDVLDLEQHDSGIVSDTRSADTLGEFESVYKMIKSVARSAWTDDDEPSVAEGSGAAGLEVAGGDVALEQDIGVALASKQDENDDYYEERRKDQKDAAADTAVPERAIKTFDTPSGRVKILYQVNENESALKMKNSDIGRKATEQPIKPNAGNFFQESEKNKVSAVVTSDGKIGILVKAKAKNGDSGDKTSRAGEKDGARTTFLTPVLNTDRKITHDQPSVWTGEKKSDATKASVFVDIPYDDEYYDSEDDLVDSSTARTTQAARTLDSSTSEGNFNTRLQHGHPPPGGHSEENGGRIPDRENVIRHFDESKPNPNRNEHVYNRSETFVRKDKSDVKNEYEKSRAKSVYLNILDILGPDSRDVIQLLNDVKHKSGERPHKKQPTNNFKDVLHDREKSLSEASVPILNRDSGRTDDDNSGSTFKEKLDNNRGSGSRSNRVNPRFEGANKDWTAAAEDSESVDVKKNLEDIWTDADDDLEDSLVRIVPVHNGHSIFKLDGRKTDRLDHFTTASYDRSASSTVKFSDERGYETSSSGRIGVSMFKMVLCYFCVFGVGVYTLFSWLRLRVEMTILHW